MKFFFTFIFFVITLLPAAGIQPTYVVDLSTYLASKSFTVNGLFFMYDFEKDGKIAKNDWLYLDSKTNNAYRLLGENPTQNNPFGWKSIPQFPDDLVVDRDLAGFFLYIDFPRDENRAFSWIYVTKDFQIYKLMGATHDNRFQYLDIDGDGVADTINVNVASFDEKNFEITFECSSCSTSATDGNTSSAGFSIDDLFPPVDEENMTQHTPGTTLVTDPTIRDIHVEKVDDAITFSDEQLKKIAPNIYRVENGDGTDLQLGKPVFLNDTFIGVVTQLNGREFEVKNAEYVNQVYKHFALTMQNGLVISQLQRMIRNGVVRGKYDDFNEKPLRISLKLHTNPLRNIDRLTNEVVLRINFPKGYKIPLKTKGISCSFWDASCHFISQFEGHRHVNLGMEYAYPDEESPYLEFSTDGSFLEIGIGSYFDVLYDYNVAADSIFRYTLAQSAYVKSDLSFKVKGNLENLSSSGLSWEKEFEPLGQFNVFIPNPYSAAVQTYVAFKPTFTLGINGKVGGTFTYKTNFYRSGEIRSIYDSITKKSLFVANIEDKGDKTKKNQVSLNIEAESNFYLFPNITIVPYLTFLKVNKPVTFFALQSGIALENTLTGKINKEFIAQPSNNIITTEAEFKSAIKGKVRGKWMIKVGDHTFYESDSYTDINETKPFVLLDWKVSLLQPPQIIEKKENGHTSVTFTSQDTKLLKYLIYFYTIGNSVDSASDIDIDRLSSYYSWRAGDAPIVVDDVKVIKVRAFLKNEEVSKSIWKWGGSVSEQRNFTVINKIEPPVATPSSTAFKGKLTVTLSQSQGYDIYYSIDGGEYVRYKSPIVLEKSARLQAFSQITFQGKKYKSDYVTFTYVQCTDDEIVQNGECVQNPNSSSSNASESSSYSGSSSSEESTSSIAGDVFKELLKTKTWQNWPYPQYCAETQPGRKPFYSMQINNHIVKCSYYTTTRGIRFEGVYKLDGTTYDGIIKLYGLYGELEYSTSYKDGKRHGVYATYFYDGIKNTLTGCVVYENDVMVGYCPE